MTNGVASSSWSCNGCHESDLTGHLLAKGGWTHLCLPAEAEAEETVSCGRVRITRAPGDLLHPEREGREEMERVKRELGAQAFAASTSSDRRLPKAGW